MAQIFTHTPGLLYKFRGDVERDVQCLLAERALFLPSPLDLNDPFDCYPALDLPAPEDRDRFIADEVARNPPEEAANVRRRLRLLFTSPLHRERFVREFYRSDLGRIGVLSLSASREHLVLWAHYARNGSGFAVGYRGVDGGRHEAVPAFPVRYSSTRPKMPILEDTNWIEILGTKSEHWAYEQEWRYVRVPEEGGAGKMSVPRGSILEVILGPRMTDPDMAKVITAARSVPDRPRILRANLLPDRFGLEFVELE